MHLAPALALIPIASCVSGMAFQPVARDIGKTYSISNVVYKSSPNNAPAFDGKTHTITFSFSDTNQQPANRVQTCTATYNPITGGGTDPAAAVRCAPDGDYAFGAAADVSNGPGGTFLNIYLFHRYKKLSNVFWFQTCTPTITKALVTATLPNCQTNSNGIGICTSTGSIPADNYSESTDTTPGKIC